MVGWKFFNLRRAFADAPGASWRILLVYSDVVPSNLVGDTKHPLVQEVAHKGDGSGSLYFKPLHVQWMPVRRPYLDVIEVQLAESNEALVKVGPGKTIVTYQFRRVGQKV